MANAGFKTWTDEGVMQLDANYENYSLLKKIKGTFKGDIFFQFGYGYLDITLTYKYPIFVALRGTYLGQKLFQHYIIKKNDTYTIRIIGNVNTEVEVYIYSKGPTYKAKNGLNIYDASGTLTFSSATPYLWLDTIVNITPSYSTGGQIIKSNNNNQVAVCIPPMTSFFRDSPNLQGPNITYFPFSSFPLIYNESYYQIVVNAENLFFSTDGFPVADNYAIFGSFVLVDVRNTEGVNWEYV